MARTKETWDEAVGGARWAELLPPAPGELKIVQAFLNTDDPKSGTEELASPWALGEWLARWGLLSGDVELGDAELEQALEVRGGLRALVRTNLGGRIDTATATRLDQAAEAALLRVRFDSRGANRFETAADGFQGALGHLFRIVAVARLGELWPRLKVCPFETCGRCFYDASRYGTRKWCSMKQCGNVIKGRAWRRRNPRRRKTGVYQAP